MVIGNVEYSPVDISVGSFTHVRYPNSLNAIMKTVGYCLIFRGKGRKNCNKKKREKESSPSYRSLLKGCLKSIYFAINSYKRMCQFSDVNGNWNLDCFTLDLTAHSG